MTVGLSSGGGYAVSGGSASINLFDNDSPGTSGGSGGSGVPVQAWITGDQDATEGGASGGIFTVHRNSSVGNLTVKYAAPDGTATNGTDYSGAGASGGSVSFVNGETTKVIAIAPADDTLVEGKETVTVGLASGGGYVIGSPSNDWIYINDNDQSLIAVDDEAYLSPGFAQTVVVLANDYDTDGDSISLYSVVSPTHGTVVANSDGTANYTPTLDFSGVDQFAYTITDGHGNFTSATVTILVSGNADGLLAVDDVATTGSEGPVTIHVTANDSDPNGHLLIVTYAGGASHGSVNLSGNLVTYIPDAGFFGTDDFSYTIDDGHGNTASATATITVTGTGVNNTPVAVSDTGSTAIGQAVTISMLSNDYDPDGDALSVISALNAAHGLVVRIGNMAIYTPVSGFTGTDAFTYIVSDGHGHSASGSVTVTVGGSGAGFNGVPIAVNDSASTAAGQSIVVGVLANDSDPDGDALILVSVGGASHGVVTLASGSAQYTPTSGFSGADSFVYTVGDGLGHTASATVYVGVGLAAPVADIDTDSNNDGAIDATDDPIEEIVAGRLLFVNGIQPAQVNLSVQIPSGQSPQNYSVRLNSGAGIVAYTSSARTMAIAPSQTYSVGTLPVSVFVDGLNPGSSALTLELIDVGGSIIATDRVVFTTQVVDLDVVLDSGSELSENLEETLGVAVADNWNHRASNLVPFILHHLDYVPVGGAYALTFDSASYAVWRNSNGTGSVLSGSPSIDASVDTLVYLDGKAITSVPNFIQLVLIQAGAPKAEDKVKAAVAQPIIYISGFGDTGLGEVKKYLDDVKTSEKDGIYKVNKNGKDFTVTITNSEKEAKAALATKDAIIDYDGHANFGVGIAFKPADIKKLSDFMNIGRDLTPINLQYMLTDDKYPLTIAAASEYGNDPTTAAASDPWSYAKTFTGTLTDPKDVKTIDYAQFSDGAPAVTAPARLHYTLKNTPALGDYHYLNGKYPELIVKAGAADMPAVKQWSKVFLASCRSGEYYLDTFNTGTVFYSVATCGSRKSSMIFVKGVIDGDTDEVIGKALNADEPKYNYKKF